jgi:hypothetical protein
LDCPQAAAIAMRRAIRNGLEPPKLHGRYNVLPDDAEAKAEAEADILAWIQHQAEKSQPSIINHQPSTKTEQKRTEQIFSIIVSVNSVMSSLEGGWIHF